MDAQARKKAVYRDKLNAKKKDKRIDSPLVRLAFHSSSFFFSETIYILQSFQYAWNC